MKVVFLDIDGTFLDFSGVIPASAVDAVHRAQANGAKVYVNTGRPNAELYDNIRSIGFDGYICSNGLYIEENSKVLHYECMDTALVQAVSEWMNGRKIGFFLEAQNGIYTNPYFIPETEHFLGKKAADSLQKTFPNLFQVKPLVYEGIAKINLVNRKEHFPELLRRFGDDLQIDVWSRTGNPAEMAEITKKGASKAKGCAFVLQRLGVSVQDSFAFGDTGGDESMIEYCGTGVAMGNGTEEAKAAADYIADTVLNDGLYKAFKKFGLI